MRNVLLLYSIDIHNSNIRTSSKKHEIIKKVNFLISQNAKETIIVSSNAVIIHTHEQVQQSYGNWRKVFF